LPAPRQSAAADNRLLTRLIKNPTNPRVLALAERRGAFCLESGSSAGEKRHDSMSPVGPIAAPCFNPLQAITPVRRGLGPMCDAVEG